MLSSAASEPGKPGSVNLDWAGISPKAAVVLDGLTEGRETGCSHGTAWFVHQLGSRLLLHAGDGEQTLRECLATSLDDVARLHKGTCDLAHPGSPCTTVAMVRQLGPTTEYLVLADSVAVFDVDDEPQAVIDSSEKNFSAHLDSSARRGSADDLADLIHDQQQHRNVKGGYWVAQVDPEAARFALAGSYEDVRGVILASDGAALLTTDFDLLDWKQLLSLAYQEGPAGVIAATRKAEASDQERTRWPRYKVSDDATAVLLRMAATRTAA